MFVRKFLSVALLYIALDGRAAEPSSPQLVPQPHSIELLAEEPGLLLAATLQVTLAADQPLLHDHFDVVNDALSRAGACKGAVVSEDKLDPTLPRVVVKRSDGLDSEEYSLSIDNNVVSIEAADLKGVAHATSTLLQLIACCPDGKLPALRIRDLPTCSYRSLMVDLGRNPHSLESLKETIDLLWFYKVDSLHLHLTDDQRFAFPSKAYPKLVTQDGMISWDEFKQLEQYAQARGVTIIPELEVPGHSGILRQAYPDVFGASSTDVANLPSSRAAIKVLLDEMIEVFPSSPYIHVGGDEAFGVPEDLQRELINELHAYLVQKGKKTVVWEGPRLGEGNNKVDEDVVQINWRTINFPADEMLAAGYPVVNAAWDPLYIVDHYPRNNFTMVSPQRIFETLQLTRFKHVNPDISTYAQPVQTETSEKLLGFCMPWWEGREVNYLPLVVPRLIPMAAVAWNHDQSRDYEKFSRQVAATEEARRDCFYPVDIGCTPLVLEQESVFAESTEVTFTAGADGDIHFTLDGSQPTLESPLYVQPVSLSESATVRAAIFDGGRQVGHGSRRTLVRVDPTANLALGKPVTASVGSGPMLSPARLTDGGTGNLDFFLGYPAEPTPIEITIDLGDIKEIRRVVTHAYSNGNTFESHAVQVSADGDVFETVSERWDRPETLSPVTEHTFPATPARYVRILTRGCKGYVFDSFSKLTEIEVFANESGEDVE